MNPELGSGSIGHLTSPFLQRDAIYCLIICSAISVDKHCEFACAKIVI